MSIAKSVVRAKSQKRDAKDSISKHSFRVKYLRKSREIWRRYNETKPWLNQFYTTFLKLKQGQRIVDVGCGTGDFTRYLATLSKGKTKIIGIDSNEKGIAAAITDTGKANLSRVISYKIGDAYKIPLDDEYADLTCCRTLLMHLTSPIKAVREMARVTKVRGSVVALEGGKMGAFFDPNDEDFSELTEEVHEAWLDGIRKLDGKEFRIGEKLPGIFQAAGLSDIKAEVQAYVWLYTDPRRKLADSKKELQFSYSMFKERQKSDRKYLVAGGITDARITAYNRKSLAKMKALLSDDKKLRNDPTFYAESLFLVSGTKTA